MCFESQYVPLSLHHLLKSAAERGARTVEQRAVSVACGRGRERVRALRRALRRARHCDEPSQSRAGAGVGAARTHR